MVGIGNQTEIIDFLSDPASYPDHIEHVDVITTHASVIFLAGDRAFKLKRAVRYSYLDYSSPELRQAACQAELTLNRRTAPDIYLAIRSIGRGADGRLQFDPAGTALDWVVVMQRFPQEALFSHLADRHLLGPRLAALTADRIAVFHAGAERTPTYGGTDGIAQVIRINDENLRRWATPGLPLADIDGLRASSLAALDRHAERLEARRLAGKVRRCHGDLHLGNICLLDGVPTLFDCIEFSDSIACIDVLYDLAFLLMDLRFRGLADEAATVFNRYLDVADDEDGLPVLPLFMSLRAAVRAHVTAAAAANARSPGGDDKRLSLVRSYFDLAIDLLRPRTARLVAVGGFSGTGKSTIAAGLAGDLGMAPGARVLRSDVLRKRLFGLPPESRLPDDAYTEAIGRRVYAELEARAVAALAAGHSVILDAVAAKASERQAFAEMARKSGVAFQGIWLDAPVDTLVRRLEARRGDASDATADVVRRQLTYDLGDITWPKIDATRSPAEVIAAARRVLQSGVGAAAI